MTTQPPGLGGEVPLDDPHHYDQRTKLVHSGQTRIYYAAACTCGWPTTLRFRVTDERAVSDWLAHTRQAGLDRVFSSDEAKGAVDG